MTLVRLPRAFQKGSVHLDIDEIAYFESIIGLSDADKVALSSKSYVSVREKDVITEVTLKSGEKVRLGITESELEGIMSPDYFGANFVLEEDVLFAVSKVLDLSSDSQEILRKRVNLPKPASYYKPRAEYLFTDKVNDKLKELAFISAFSDNVAVGFASPRKSVEVSDLIKNNLSWGNGDKAMIEFTIPLKEALLRPIVRNHWVSSDCNLEGNKLDFDAYIGTVIVGMSVRCSVGDKQYCGYLSLCTHIIDFWESIFRGVTVGREDFDKLDVAYDLYDNILKNFER